MPTPVLEGWQSARQVVRARLSTLPGGGGLTVPSNLKIRLADGPYRVIDEAPGTDDGLTFLARVIVVVFARTYDEGRSHSEACRQSLLATPWHVEVSGQVVVADRVRTQQSPFEVPWGDQDVRRWEATYGVEYRR